MHIIWRCFGQQPRLETQDVRPFSPGVEQGPQPGDRRDSYERVVAHEAPGDPEPDGPFRRLARAVRAYEIFPPWLVSGVRSMKNSMSRGATPNSFSSAPRPQIAAVC